MIGLRRLLEKIQSAKAPHSAAMRDATDPESDAMQLQALQQRLNKRNRAPHQRENIDGEH